MRISLIGLVASLTLAVPAAAQVQTKEQQACTVGVNKAFAKVAAVAAKDVGGCLKDAANAKLVGTAEACAAGDLDGKVAATMAKTTDTFASTCVGPGLPPPYGVTTADAVNGAAVPSALDAIHDVFGPDLDAAIISAAADKDASKCQLGVAKRLAKCASTTVKEFVKCKQDGLERTTAPIDDADGIGACVGADAKGTIAKQCDLLLETSPPKFKLDAIRKTLDKCLDAGVDLAAALPGCDAADREGAHACAGAAVACRVCTALTAADGLDVDCDLVDDGADNASCAGPALTIGQHQCTLDPTASVAVFDTTSFFLFLGLDGTLTYDCGEVDPATQTAACTCTIDDIAPIQVSGLGWACMTSAPGCAPGVIDCDGGSGFDQSIVARHNIGTCTGNAHCAAQCATVCGAAEVYDSGCEGFCKGGQSDGQACIGDLQCTGGLCNGPDRVFNGNICECQCMTVGGVPSRPGGMRCNLGVDITVEANTPCGDGDVVLDIGRQCLPFTTEGAQGILLDANNTLNLELPPGGHDSQGLPLACETLAADGTSGLFTTSAVTFFEAPIARDSAFLFVLGCQ